MLQSSQKRALFLIIVLAIVAAIGTGAYYSIAGRMPSKEVKGEVNLAASYASESPSPLPGPNPEFIFGGDVVVGDFTLKILKTEIVNRNDEVKPAFQEPLSLIAVHRKDNPEPVQILKGYMNYSPYLISRLEVRTEDVNFDGHQDIKFLRDVTVKSSSWNYWLYDPVSGLFPYNESLSEIYNLVVDPVGKTLTSSEGCGVSCGTLTTYNFYDNKAVPVRIVHQGVVFRAAKNGVACEPLSCPTFHRTVKESRNGRMMVVSSETREEPF